ncbi:protein turtle-like isoform X2 [Brevipalpus obovatus]|uniref:protein turtle-like isoform X2 n=1 Tax=Brevipalpus obovatus TaxID=246614 RepID=UPI003D9EF2D2
MIWHSLVPLCPALFLCLSASFLKSDFIEINVPVESKVQIPCNVSLHKGDALVLLWYKNMNATGPPIYTLDFRSEVPKHFVNEEFKGRIIAKDDLVTPSLVIKKTTPQDDGIFSCRADYKWSRTQSSVVKLNVIVPPKQMYIKDSDNQRVYAIAGPYPEDSPMSLTCVAENGKPPPRIVWYLNDTMVDESYEMTAQSGLKSKQGIETLTNANGNVQPFTAPASTSIRIEMHLKPLGVTIFPNQEPLVAGKKTEVTCKTWGSRPTARVSWFLRNKELKRTRLVHSNDGNSSTSTLIMVPSPDDDGASLVCRAQNSNVKTSYSSQFSIEDKLPLKVLYKPKVSIDIVDDKKYAIKGSSVIITCKVASNLPTRSIQWYFNDKPMTTFDRADSSSAFENNSLVIKSVTSEHAGQYHCSTGNALGSTESKPLMLQVVYEPVCSYVNIKKNYQVKRGFHVDIQCVVDAKPSDNLTFTWSQASALTTSTRRSLSNFTSQGVQSSLKYRPQNVIDFGFIYCSARNIVGSQVEPCIFSIKPVIEPPKPPRDCLLMNNSANLYTVICEKFSPAQNFDVESYVLEIYEPKSAQLIHRSQESEPIFKVVPENHKNIKEYHLRVYAKNSIGKSNPVYLTLKNERQLKLNQVVNNNSLSEENSNSSGSSSHTSYMIAFSPIIMLILILLARVKCHIKRQKTKVAETNTPTTASPPVPSRPIKEEDSSEELIEFERKDAGKSSAPDIIELGCNSLIVTRDKEHELNLGGGTTHFIMNDDTDYALNLILTGPETEIDDNKQRVFCVSTLV